MAERMGKVQPRVEESSERLCSQCQAKLSIHNNTGQCFHHGVEQGKRSAGSSDMLNSATKNRGGK